MSWFIFSEVMFFAAFFGALYYARVFSVPWLGGEGAKLITHEILWPDFYAEWPLLVIPDLEKFASSLYTETIPAWGVPALNTLILLSSGVTVTFAHWALKKNNRKALCWWLFATVALGVLFVSLQAFEYVHAYQDLNLRLDSGIYGSTFFMLTGFHGFHVTMGATMLLVILIRAMRGHFSAHNHFAFEAVAWYWHFVDVVWLGLFIFVYWL
jgi:cytochrome c oxidase subunit 3